MSKWNKIQSAGTLQHFLFRFSSTDLLKSLCLLSQETPQIAENESFAVIVLGRVRPIDQDYIASSAAQWLLELCQQHPRDYYANIAGFFNLILVDKKASSFSLVQDHIASKPLYVCEPESGHWLVSSSNRLLEKQLGSEALKLSHQAIFNYCYFHCIPSPGSIYEGVSKLSPGEEFSVFDTNQSKSQNRYVPEYNYTDAALPVSYADCQKVVDDAVRRNISDKTGAFLSGGLDSSTVAGMMARHQQKPATFSIGFDAKGYDETEYAEITAKHFATEHKVHYLKPDEIVENFVEVAGYFDEPFGNSSAMAAYVCAQFAHKHGIDVMLGGDGGDEIFAGNERYAKQKKFEFFAMAPKIVQQLADTAFAQSPLSSIPGFSKAASYINQAKVPLPDRLESYNYLNRFPLEQMFDADFLASVDISAPIELQRQRFAECSSENTLEKMLYLDW